MSVVYNAARIDGDITKNWGNNWVLVWSLDAYGNTSSIQRPSIMYSIAYGSQAYTYAQINAYKGGAGWTEALFTSVLYPSVRWVFKRSANSTNLPLVLQALLAGGNPATYLTVNGEYSVTLDATQSSVPVNASTSLQFMHNWGSGEAGDIPTLGRPGGYVWNTGMYWGNIDAFSNYGGLLNKVNAHSGSGGGNTGDRLLVYIR